MQRRPVLITSNPIKKDLDHMRLNTICVLLGVLILLMPLEITLKIDMPMAEAAEEDGTGSPFGFHPAVVSKSGYNDNGFNDAINIGVKWTRPDLYAFWSQIQPDIGVSSYTFTAYDLQYGSVPDEVNILANIAGQPGAGSGDRYVSGTYIPIDEDKYVDFVKATVERYDGDGTDDMPGLTNPIRYWQVANEPNATTRTDFAQLQMITYTAIKEACEECQVVIGGVGGLPNNYVNGFEDDYVPILEDLDGQYIDIFDFHWYGDAAGEYRFKDSLTGEDVLDALRDALADNGFPNDLPVWVTEMGSYSGALDGDPEDFQSEREQAGDYFKRFIYSLARGVDKIFPAFGLMEGFKNTDGYFDHTGLIYDGENSSDLGLGVKKLGYYTYKRMTEILEGSDWSTITTLRNGTDSDLIYLFRVEKNGEPIYVAWWDYFDESGYSDGDAVEMTISGLIGDEVAVSEVVPFAETGQEVSSYPEAFETTTYPVVDGEATFSLQENPVLISGPQAFSSPPIKPELKSPSNKGTGVTLTPSLETESFSDTDENDFHSKTDWQISSNEEFQSLVIDESSTTDLEQFSVPEGVLQYSTTYYWRVRFYDAYNAESEWSETFSFTTTVDPEEADDGDEPVPPDQPVLRSPANGSADVSLTPQLQTQAFNDQNDGDIHLFTDWQISTGPNFTELVFEDLKGMHLMSLNTPDLILNSDSVYFWRVRFYDISGSASEWSVPFRFTTRSDSDDRNSNGIPDTQEVDESVDLDGDGTPDLFQETIKSVLSSTESGSIGVKVGNGVVSIESTKAIDPATITDTSGKPEDLPIGLIAFKAQVDSPGATATVTIYFSDAVESGSKWYKYDSVNGWQDYSAFAQFSADGKSVVLEITDGGTGDADGTENGFIVDPGGPGVERDNGESVSSSSSGGGGGGCFLDTLVFHP
jgi:hypothetical protein